LAENAGIGGRIEVVTNHDLPSWCWGECRRASSCTVFLGAEMAGFADCSRMAAPLTLSNASSAWRVREVGAGRARFRYRGEARWKPRFQFLEASEYDGGRTTGAGAGIALVRRVGAGGEGRARGVLGDGPDSHCGRRAMGHLARLGSFCVRSLTALTSAQLFNRLTTSQ